MPGDPKECRTHALNCALLAKSASSAESRATFLHLQRSWTRLAEELEQAEALLNDIGTVDTPATTTAEPTAPD
jgi:hypothetical protein